jgi:uncharacterized protein YrrD
MIEMVAIVFFLTIASTASIIALFVYIDMRKEQATANRNRNFGFSKQTKLKSKKDDKNDKYHGGYDG